MKELHDLLDALPYWLLFVLPVFIALSPYNPVCDASELNFPIHRLAQFEISGNRYGSKTAALSIEARTASTAPSNLLRKIVIVKIHEVSVAKVSEILNAGAGGILFVLPNEVTEETKDRAQFVEEYLLSTEHEVPIYFTQETEDINKLLDDLEGLSTEKTVSAAQAMFAGISSNGYQMSTSSNSVPQPMKDISQTSIEAVLRGQNDGDKTVVVVAHYDAIAAAPGLSFGADSNGSGVTVLLELVRIFSKIYSNPKTRPPTNLVFLLSAAGKWNFYGTKRWLEEQGSNSELLADVSFVACLDSLGGGRNNHSQLYLHVSKPHKDDTPAGKFFNNLRTIASEGHPEGVKLIHKKINLADDNLPWEHERFSIRRIPAFTLSMMSKPQALDRSSAFDTVVNEEIIAKTTKNVAEALLCSLYDHKDCQAKAFADSLSPDVHLIKKWTEYLAKTPRHASLLTSGPQMKKFSNEPSIIDVLGNTLQGYKAEVKFFKSKLEKQDPEFTFYDMSVGLTMSAHRVKPAVFDLILTCFIGAYLGILYLIIVKFDAIAKALYLGFPRFLICWPDPLTQNHYTNGHHKVK